MGRGGNTWASISSANRAWLDEKKLNLLVQIGFEPEPDLPHVPLLQDLLKDEEAKQIVNVVSLPTVIGYAHWVAPGVPGERVQALRAAYAATLKDPAFLEEAKKLNMLVRPLSGEQLEDLVKRAAGTPKPVLDRTAKLLNWGS